MWMGHRIPLLSCLTARSTLLRGAWIFLISHRTSHWSITLMMQCSLDLLSRGQSKHSWCYLQAEGGDKSWESSRACHTCTMFVQWSGACQDISSKVPNTKDKITAIMASLNFGGNVYLIWVFCSDHLPVLNGLQSKKMFCSRPRPLYKLPWQYNLDPVQVRQRRC